jgi:hypothetical protein
MQSLFLSKVPVNKSPPGTPMELPIYKAFFYISLKFLTKVSLNKVKKFFPSLKGPRKGASSKFPKSGAPIETDIHF